MSYIIMAVQEEGSETRISDFDENARGFDTVATARAAYHRIISEEMYPEYRQIWVEELKDAAYWYERYANEDHDSLYDGQEDY